MGLWLAEAFVLTRGLEREASPNQTCTPELQGLPTALHAVWGSSGRPRSPPTAGQQAVSTVSMAPLDLPQARSLLASAQKPPLAQERPPQGMATSITPKQPGLSVLPPPIRGKMCPASCAPDHIQSVFKAS